MRHLNFPFHPHSDQMSSIHIGLFTESSPLRKLFHSSADFQFCMERVTRYGPTHECFNTYILLYYAESILSIIEKNIEILPIEEGVTLTCCSPGHTEMVLPLKYPQKLLNDLRLSNDSLFYLSEGPIERILTNVLMATVYHYYSLYINS